LRILCSFEGTRNTSDDGEGANVGEKLRNARYTFANMGTDLLVTEAAGRHHSFCRSQCDVPHHWRYRDTGRQIILIRDQVTTKHGVIFEPSERSEAHSSVADAGVRALPDNLSELLHSDKAETRTFPDTKRLTACLRLECRRWPHLAT